MKEIIAERKLLFCPKNSSIRKELSIRLGAPYVDKDGLARCHVEWDGLFENFADIAGIDPLHALHLASNVDSMLQMLRDQYDFYWPTGEPYFDD